MEATIIGGFVKEIITSLGGFAQNEIVRVLGLSGEIEKLAENLDRIREEINNSDVDPTIADTEPTDNRLKKLIDVAYEAENVIDRFKIKMSILRTSQLQVPNQTMQSQARGMKQLLLKFQEWRHSSVCKSCREVGTRCHTAKRIEQLNKRLEDMMSSKELPQMVQNLVDRLQSRLARSSRMDGPCHDEHNSIGSFLSNDCKDHMKRLQEKRVRMQTLFAIVGPPGMGKTTLARKIYHEMRTVFRTRRWVYVSSSSSTGTGTGGELNMWLGDDRGSQVAACQETIREYLMGSSSLLLVIDNVCDSDGWEFLGQHSVQDGFLRHGVRVIVTTPSWDAANSMGVNMSSCCHHVRALNEDDGWRLLYRTAQLKEREATGNIRIQEVGKGIVRKCSGIPLALQAVGSRLRFNDKVEDWESQLSSSCNFITMYREIQRSIDATYMKLGYRLKRCFLYCSLYPEGSVMQRQHITQQWIAEGFFEGGREDPEEQARQCYAELLNRRLLLPLPIPPAGSAAATDGCADAATLPTLLRSYALYRSENENYVSDPSRIGSGFNVWRLSATDVDTVHSIPGDTMSLMRTLLVFGCSGSPRDDTTLSTTTAPLLPSVMDVICRKFTSLRVLDIRDTRVEAIGPNLGRLLQLRYLCLSNTRIRQLPREVRNLVMLQFLILNNCPCLTSLPAGVGRLKNLKSLDISGTPVLQPLQLQFRLHNLKELNCFRGFIPVSSSAYTGLPGGSRSSHDGWTFMELSKLSKLTSLQILKIGRSTSSQEAAQLRLHDKSHLKELELCCTPVVGHVVGHGDRTSASGADAESESIGLALHALKPPQQLASLKLANFYDAELPSWVSSSHLTVLQRLTLDGCDQCRQLPPLGDMKHLEFLAITGAGDLYEIGNELRGVPRSSEAAFPKLEQLMVSDMKNLQTWSGLEARDMPSLRSFQLLECPRLRDLPSWLPHCMSLASLKIRRAEEITAIGDLPAVKELQVSFCRALQRICNLGRLEDLDIVSCSGLQSVQGVPLLRSVRLREHAADLPQWLLLAHKKRPLVLSRLEIVSAEGLLDKCSSELAPYWPVIQAAADHVHAKLHDGSFYFSYTRIRGAYQLYRSPRCIDRADMHRGGRSNQKALELGRLFTAILLCSGLFLTLFSNPFGWLK